MARWKCWAHCGTAETGRNRTPTARQNPPGASVLKYNSFSWCVIAFVQQAPCFLHETSTIVCLNGMRHCGRQRVRSSHLFCAKVAPLHLILQKKKRHWKERTSLVSFTRDIGGAITKFNDTFNAPSSFLSPSPHTKPYFQSKMGSQDCKRHFLHP